MKKDKKGFFKNRIKYFLASETDRSRLQDDDWEADVELEDEEIDNQEEEQDFQNPEEPF